MARRQKSIMHGSADSTRVYHHEHRSKKNRNQSYKYERMNKEMFSEINTKRDRRQNKQAEQEWKKKEL